MLCQSHSENTGIDSPVRQRLIVYAICALLLAAVLVAYRGAPHNGFVYDDYGYILLNDRIHAGLTFDVLAWASTTDYSGNWHPITWVSHALDCGLYGSRPVGHHLTSLLLHLANTLLLFALLRTATGSLWRSAFVAVLFGVHPLHVESVAWISERKDVLSTFFGLLASICYVANVRRPDALKKVAVILFFFLGLMSKPMLVTLPLVFLLLDYWPLDRVGDRATSLPRLVKEKWPLIALSVASGVVTVMAQRTGSTMANLGEVSFAARFGNAVVSYAAYIRKMFWPNDLVAFYPHPRAGLSEWQVAAAGAFLLVVSLVVIRARRRRYLTVGWLWYLITLLPVIGLLQVGGQAMADRYTYIPLIGLYVMLAWGVPDLFKGRRAIVGLTVLAVLAAAALTSATHRQVSYWKDNETLFTHALKHTRDNWVASYTLGLALSDRKDYPGALPHAREAVRVQPYNPASYMLLGTVLTSLEEFDEAIAALSQAAAMAPADAEAHAALARAFYLSGDTEAAHEAAEAALHLDPHNQTALRVLSEIK